MPDPVIIETVDKTILGSLGDEIQRLRGEIQEFEVTNVSAKICTVEVEKESGEPPQVFAMGDTVFQDYGELRAKYRFPPENKFDFHFMPFEPPALAVLDSVNRAFQEYQLATQIKLQAMKPKFYEKREFGILVGFIAARIVTRWIEK